MKVTIFGAGAVGLYLAGRLLLSGKAVSVVARGPALAALRARGVRYEWQGHTHTFPVRATDTPDELGSQDMVLIAVKAHAMTAAAPAIAKLLGPNTVLVPTQNGVPWWYTYRIAGALEGARLRSIDPDGTIDATLNPARALGCVVVMAASTPEPGMVKHLSGNELILGEPDGSHSARLDRVATFLTEGGINIVTTDRIRDALWVKLWGNMTFNPVSVLTRATLLDLATDPDALSVLRPAMREAQAVGEATEIKFDRDIEARIEDSRILGAHKSSMLQDFEAGRPLEIEPLLGAVVELGRKAQIATPTLDAIGALVRLAANSRRSAARPE